MRMFGAALGAVVAMVLGCGGTTLVASDRAASTDAGPALASVTIFENYSTVPNGTALSGAASVDLEGSTIAVKNALAGDVIYVDFDGQAMMPANSGISLLAHISSSAPDGVTLDNGGWQQSNATGQTGAYQSTFFSAYTLTTSGDFTASIRSSVTGSGTVAIYGGVVRVRLERP